VQANPKAGMTGVLMRYKEYFTVYPRKLKKMTVYYYQCYDNDGKRTCGHSTGQRTRTAAKMYCMELYRKGKLIPEKKPMSFAEFAEGWWNPETCKYLKWRQVQNPLSPSTIDHYKTNLELHIKPYFGKMRLNAILPEIIQNWITRLSLEGYTNSSINIKVATLKAMLNEAARLKLIHANPAERIKKLKADNKEVQILKPEEARMLFPPDWRKIWDSYESFVFNKLAACTGMRLSEIMGLKSEHVRNDHIHVCVQYSTKYGVRPLKTKDSRDIPITGRLYGELLALISKNNPGYIFSDCGGREPISRNRLYKETGNAFEKIGINSEERKNRRITVHHWRHFLNTALLMANVSTLKIQKVTGHKSLSMTKHYAHFDCRDFTEVLDFQNSLFSAPACPEPALP
jgi:integrase